MLDLVALIETAHATPPRDQKDWRVPGHVVSGSRRWSDELPPILHQVTEAYGDGIDGDLVLVHRGDQFGNAELDDGCGVAGGALALKTGAF